MPTPVCSDLWMLSSISAPMFSQHCNTDVQLIIGTQLPFLAFTSSTMWTQKRLCVKSSCLSATSHNLWTLLEVVSWSDLSTYVARVGVFFQLWYLGSLPPFLGCLSGYRNQWETFQCFGKHTVCVLFLKGTGQCWEHWPRLGPVLSSVTIIEHFSIDLALGVVRVITIAILFFPTRSFRCLLLWHSSTWDWACSSLSPKALQMSRWRTRECGSV